MSISKSFNKRTGVYYAYDTSYEWDDIKQKKVQKRRCIGKYNPISNEIVPNGKVGRPAGKLKMLSCSETASDQQQHITSAKVPNTVSKELLVLKQKMSTFERALESFRLLSDEAENLKAEIDRVYNLIK